MNERKHSDDIPNLAGSWEATTVRTSEARFLVVGRIRLQTRSTLRVEIVQDGRDLEMQTELTDVAIDINTAAVSVTIPEAAVENIATVGRPGRIESTDDGFDLVIPGHSRAEGVDLDDPEHDELPESAEDRRVVDQSGDGRPGMTIELGGLIDGQMQIVNRAWDRWRGEIGADEIRGQLEWEDETKLLSATNRWLNLSPKLTPVLGEDQSYFWMRPVDES